MSSSVMGRRISGSLTVASAVRTSSTVTVMMSFWDCSVMRTALAGRGGGTSALSGYVPRHAGRRSDAVLPWLAHVHVSAWEF